MEITSYVMCGVWVLTATMYVIERARAERREKELLNRLMARDFADFTAGEVALRPDSSTEEPEPMLDALPIV